MSNVYGAVQRGDESASRGRCGKKELVARPTLPHAEDGAEMNAWDKENDINIKKTGGVRWKGVGGQNYLVYMSI